MHVVQFVCWRAEFGAHARHRNAQHQIDDEIAECYPRGQPGEIPKCQHHGKPDEKPENGEVIEPVFGVKGEHAAEHLQDLPPTRHQREQPNAEPSTAALLRLEADGGCPPYRAEKDALHTPEKVEKPKRQR